MRRAPRGSCDSHLHIIGPTDRFPLSASRSYTPCEASVEEYRRVQRTLGTERLVIVQASVHSTDNACMLDRATLRVRVPRGIAVIDPDVPDATPKRMDALGVRGVRFNRVTRGGLPLQAMVDVARRIAPLGWHVQLYVAGEQLAELRATLERLPVDVVLDHLAGLRPKRPRDHAARAALDGLLADGRTWIKLCGYRSSMQGHPFDDVGPIATKLVANHAGRCVWGTDGPHPAFERAMPHDGELLDALMRWAPNWRSNGASSSITRRVCTGSMPPAKLPQPTGNRHGHSSERIRQDERAGDGFRTGMGDARRPRRRRSADARCSVSATSSTTTSPRVFPGIIRGC